jgi:hypothetical protein
MESAVDLDAVRATFDGCDGAAGPGGVIEGEARLYIPGNDADTLPLVTTATVTVFDATGNEHAACYLDDDGTFDAGATVTGETGRFAVFGLDEGPVVVDIVYDTGETEPEVAYWRWVSDGGVVPMHPAWVGEL